MPDPLWEYLVTTALTKLSLAEVEPFLDACEEAPPLSEDEIDRIVAFVRARTAKHGGKCS